MAGYKYNADQKKVLTALEDLKKLCHRAKMPMVAAVCVLDDNGEPVYTKESVPAATVGITLPRGSLISDFVKLSVGGYKLVSEGDAFVMGPENVGEILLHADASAESTTLPI